MFCEKYVFPGEVGYKGIGVQRVGGVDVERVEKDGNSYWVTSSARYSLAYGPFKVGKEKCVLTYDNGPVTVSWGGGREIINTAAIERWVSSKLLPTIKEAGGQKEERGPHTGTAHLYSVPARPNARSKQYTASTFVGQPPLAMTDDGRLFAIEAGRLWKIDLADNGRARAMKGSTWSGEVALTAVGNELYAIEAERLWAIDPDTGKVKVLLGDESNPTVWKGRVSLAGYKDGGETHLYAIEHHFLWRIDVSNGSATVLKGTHSKPVTWKDDTQLVSARQGLLAIENKQLHVIDTRNGNITQHPGTYSEGVTACSDGEIIYVIDKNNLYSVNPKDGRQTELKVRFKGQPKPAARAGVVYAIELD
jgi:hypothetical protein